MKPVLTHALRELGPAALLRFGQYRLSMQTGLIRRRTAPCLWSDRPLASWVKPSFESEPEAYTTYRLNSAPRFFIPPTEALRESLHEVLGERSRRAIEAADGLREGTFELFGFHRAQLGCPPDWHCFAPLTGDEGGSRAASTSHWSEIELVDLQSDVKLLWELNRFGWAFSLARAYALTLQPRYCELFWQLVRSWRSANPPNCGLNWHSAQEVSIRLMALTFAFYAMQPELAKHPVRVAELAATIAVHARRIPPTLSYAIAQGNNHLLVEAAALYTVGSLFPEFRQAVRWRRTGRRWFVRALDEQVFPDGGYVQHSVNYHRLALQTALWVARIAEIRGEPLPAESQLQIGRMLGWMECLVDPVTGTAPNFGPNDGAEILPLSTLPFDDHRPVLQAASRWARNEPVYPQGAWDEWSLWLGVGKTAGRQALSTGGSQACSLPDSGLYRLAGVETRGFVRAAHFEKRPGHADQMHVDLWFNRWNLAIDAGTYLYNAGAPWDNALSGAGHHNTVIVDGAEAMLPAGRFLWLKWNQATIEGHWRSEDGVLEAFSAARYADLERRVVHRRVVLRAGERRWLIVDDLLGEGEHHGRLNWLIPDLPWSAVAGSLQLTSPAGIIDLSIEGGGGEGSLYRAGDCLHGEQLDEPTETLGWFSPTYALKHPALQFITCRRSQLPMRFRSSWTWVDPQASELQVEWNSPSMSGLPFGLVSYADSKLELDDAHLVDPSGVRRTG